jgi:spoIIIJ-associated protein
MNNKDQIQSFIEEFIKKLTPDATILVLAPKDLTIPVEIKVDDAQILIGQGGQTLQGIQHLLKIILKRKLNQDIYVDIDINNYKKMKNEYLKELARSSANEAAIIKQKILLAPMSAYERRIIHMELAGRLDVITESIGQGYNRKVAIKPR